MQAKKSFGEPLACNLRTPKAHSSRWGTSAADNGFRRTCEPHLCCAQHKYSSNEPPRQKNSRPSIDGLLSLAESFQSQLNRFFQGGKKPCVIRVYRTFDKSRNRRKNVKFSNCSPQKRGIFANLVQQKKGAK